jgi:hypothetical protein
MRISTYTLEFITPCFCAGANQAAAEIRAPAIRGQLRWWFRALGGSAADERSVFGGVAGNASASSLIVRAAKISDGPRWQPPVVNPNASDSYVWYFASVSGKVAKSKEPGPRWRSEGALAPGTRIRLSLIQRRSIAATLQQRLDDAVTCFLLIGSLGLRATRGLGSFACIEKPFTPASATTLKAILQRAGFRSEHRNTPLNDIAAAANEIGSLVKGTRKALGLKPDRLTAFGSAQPDRQTSAVWLRPVRPDGKTHFELYVFEAPHDRVLDPQADPTGVVGFAPSKLVRATPSARPRY